MYVAEVASGPLRVFYFGVSYLLCKKGRVGGVLVQKSLVVVTGNTRPGV